MQEKLSVKKIYTDAFQYAVKHLLIFSFLTIFYFLGCLLPMFIKANSVIFLIMLPYYYLFLYSAASCYFKQRILFDKQVFFAAGIRFLTTIFIFLAVISLSTYIINHCFGFISTAFVGGKLVVKFILNSAVWLIIKYMFIFVLVIFFFIIPSFAFISEISGKSRSLLTTYVKTKGNFIQICLIVFVAFGITLLVLLPFRYFSPIVAELTRAVILVFNSIVYFKMYDFFYALPANNNSDKEQSDTGEILLASAQMKDNTAHTVELEISEDEENAD